VKNDAENGKPSKSKKEKPQKGCYWNWLVDAEIKTFEAWNKDRSDQWSND
jgi:hypothetical protein